MTEVTGLDENPGCESGLSIAWLYRTLCVSIGISLTSHLAAAEAPRPARIDKPVILGSETIPSGSEPNIRITGLPPNAAVQVMAVRIFAYWSEDGRGGWAPKPRRLISWADMTAGRDGSLDLAHTDVKSGSWQGRDAYGLFWSARRSDDPKSPTLPSDFDPTAMKEGEGVVLVAQGGRVMARAPLHFTTPETVTVTSVAEGMVNGAFAAPRGAEHLPTIILLHGSEGGDVEEARQSAARFASQGFAVFALNYFAWDFKGITTIPNVHVNTEIETIGKVRDWLANRPEVDVSRLGLWGVSKGAEFVEVAAIRYPEIKAAIACVGSDSVWEGYGLDDPRATRGRENRQRPARISSWSWKGEPLPYIPLLKSGSAAFFNNTERYERSRAMDHEVARRALIPIESARASFLLIGGDRDETWASGAMVRRLANRMRAAGRSRDVEEHVFAGAGHQICGDGTYPPHAYADDQTVPGHADLDAEGKASSETWRLTIDFFRRRL